MITLYLIRHGETIWNCEKKTQGCTDIKLTKKGLMQAELLGDRLKRSNKEFNNIYTSTLNRCTETAKIIGDRLNLSIKKLYSLRELEFGNWEGLTIDEINRKFPDAYLSWRNKPHKTQIPNGESLVKLQNRCLKAVNKIINEEKNGNVIIVSHGTAIKTILLGILGLDLKHFYKITLNNASLNIIELREYGPVLVKLNDTNHL